MNDNTIKYKSSYLTDKDLSKLTEDPSAEVYEYVHEQQKHIAKMEALSKSVECARKESKRLHEEHPTWTDEEVRTCLEDNHPICRKMHTTHPRIFSILTSRNCTDVQVNALYKLMDLKQMQDTGTDEVQVLRKVEQVILSSANQQRNNTKHQ